MAGAEAFSTLSLGVHDQRAAAEHREHGGHARRKGRLGHLRGMHLSLADPEGEDGTATEHCSEQREEKGLESRAHTHRSYAGFHRRFGLSALVLPALFTRGSRNDANTSPARSRFGACATPTQTSSTRSGTTSSRWPASCGKPSSEGTAALLEGDAQRAERVISNDARIDALREQIEEHSFELLSLQNPVAGDLRMLVASLRMVSEFERMGDLAVHIAKIARLRVPDVAVPDQVVPMIARMAAVAEVMIGKVEHIIADSDVAAAKELEEVDQEMDLPAPQLLPRAARLGLDPRRRAGRRHRPARPLLRADRRPRRLDRPTRGLPGHRRAPAVRLTGLVGRTCRRFRSTPMNEVWTTSARPGSAAPQGRNSAESPNSCQR